MTSQLIRSGLSNHPSNQVRAKVVFCKTLTTITRSVTAQPPGFHPSTLRITTHIQQVAPLGGSYPTTEAQLVYFTAPTNWEIIQYSLLIFLSILLLYTIHINSILEEIKYGQFIY